MTPHRPPHRQLRGRSRPRLRSALAVATGVGVAAALLAPATLLTAAPATAEESRDLYLVTLDGPGLAAVAPGPARDLADLQVRAQQDAVLGTVAAPAPAYRFRTALNGLAVELTAAQAADLAVVPGVARVEQDRVRPLAGRGGAADPARLSPGGASRGGAGIVIGLVDTGLDPDSPLFAAGPRLGRDPAGAAPQCRAEPSWGPGWCTEKVVAGAWFVKGFGTERLASSARLAPLDDTGHGTQVASIAAGNADVAVRLGGEEVGRYSGVAPQARIAVYKACWTAPDPGDDGCSTADLVAAVDRATADGVDVLNLSVGGPSGLDTLALALLGAAEADVVVVGAAGNGGAGGTAHSAPWVTTVGAVSGLQRRGEVRLGAGTRLVGAMAATERSPRARLVRAADAAAPGTSAQQARRCAPGSLDTALVAGRIVLCERGGVGRVDKSQAVAAADGVGMVLANTGPGGVEADLHTVPTVHLSAREAGRLRSWAARHPRGAVVLAPRPVTASAPEVLDWSGTGDPAAAHPKPDVVAPGEGVLGAVPDGSRWELLTGTSASAARVSGVAARLRAERGWSATAVRSALVTTADPLPAGILRAGAGRVRQQLVASPGLVLGLDPADYRSWLEGERATLNTPALVVRRQGTVTRTVTNVGRRSRYVSTSAVGLDRHPVTVTPAAVVLAPGESHRITVRVGLGDGSQEDGAVLLRTGDGTRTRLPLLVTR